MFAPRSSLFAALIALSMVALTCSAARATSCGDPLTDDDNNQSWAVRHSPTSQGNVLWFDAEGVYFFDGASSNRIWDVDPNVAGHENAEDFVFGLGDGAADGEVVGLWRAGTDFAWVWRNDGNEAKLVNATNPIDANMAMNPEGIAIADGCVFVVLQAFANAESVKHLFQVDPATGDATNLTGDGEVPGVSSRVRTDGCQAAWTFDDGTGVLTLKFYDGSNIVDVDTDAYPGGLADGRLVYTKLVGAVEHVFLYDSHLANPSPVQISPDDGRPNESPVIDGRHVAWIHANPDNSFRRVMLLGGLVLNDDDGYAAAQPLNREAPLQLHRGQLLWQDADGELLTYHDGLTDVVCDLDQTAYEETWLTDGFVAAGGLSDDTGADLEIFRFVGTPPNDSEQPAPPLLLRATPADGGVMLEWDLVLGATGYRVYVASEPGVTPANHMTLAAGRRLDAEAPPLTVDCLSGATHYFVITTVDGDEVGPASYEVSAAPTTGADDGDGDGTPDCGDECPDDPDDACHDLPDNNGNSNENENENENDNTDDDDNGNDNTDGPDGATIECGEGMCGTGMAGLLPMMLASMPVVRRTRRPA